MLILLLFIYLAAQHADESMSAPRSAAASMPARRRPSLEISRPVARLIRSKQGGPTKNTHIHIFVCNLCLVCPPSECSWGNKSSKKGPSLTLDNRWMGFWGQILDGFLAGRAQRYKARVLALSDDLLYQPGSDRGETKQRRQTNMWLFVFDGAALLHWMSE